MNKASKFNTLNASELKAKRTDFAAKVDRLNSQLSGIKIDIDRLVADIVDIDRELDRRSRPAPEPRITDHALLRYIERAFSIDIESIKSRIMTPNTVQAIKNGATAVTVDGLKFKVHDNSIVTVMIPEGQKAKTKKPRTANELQEGLDDYYDETMRD